MLMSYDVEVIRGWPQDGSLDNYETLDTGVTVSNGDLVRPVSNNKVTNLAAGGVGVGAGNGIEGGLVVVGNGDSASAAQSGKATVLWGNAIIRVRTSKLAAAWAAPAVGQKVTVRSTGNTAKYEYDLAATTDTVVGFVKEVNAGTTTNTANVVIVLK